MTRTELLKRLDKKIKYLTELLPKDFEFETPLVALLRACYEQIERDREEIDRLDDALREGG